MTSKAFMDRCVGADEGGKNLRARVEDRKIARKTRSLKNEIVQRRRLRRQRRHTTANAVAREKMDMKITTLTLPELILVGATRGMLGAGLALLLAKRLSNDQRQAAGVVLTVIGLLTTLPLAAEIIGKTESQ